MTDDLKRESERFLELAKEPYGRDVNFKAAVEHIAKLQAEIDRLQQAADRPRHTVQGIWDD